MSTRASPRLTETISPALAAFDVLCAEDEPWLDACFVPPPDFEWIAGARSVLVLGEPGSGKTALYQALLRRLQPIDRKPNLLVVEWQPVLLSPDTPIDSAAAQVTLEHVLTACVSVLSNHVARWPDEFHYAPEDVQNTLAWFARKYLSLASRDCSSALLAYSGQDEFLERAEPTHRIAELVKAIGVIGLAGVRVMVGPDRLDNWDSIRPGLSALLSSLNLLKEPRFIYKLVLPADKGRGLLSTTGVERRRLEVILLQWFEPELVAIVEKRIALATDNKATRLEDLCEDNKLIEWLTRYGGYLPRGWLEQTRTLISHYFTRGRTLTIREWEEIRRRRPPRLVVNLETGRVAIGELEIKDIGQVELALLRYLYQHRDRICTREELYYQAYYPSVYPGQTAKHIPPKDYEGVLDTALWRLRGAVEPDPKHPIFVITRRGKGVQLDNAW